MAKIMLVEDDNNLRQIYEDRLIAEGYTVVSAADGEAALALAVKERPDLIIADVMMPKVSGFDMLDILRSTPETRDAKIIMMTALSQAEDKTRAEKLGADKYLVKSQVTLEDVVEVANQMLNDQQAGASIAATGAVTSEPSQPAPTTLAPAPAPQTASIPVSAPPEPTAPPTQDDQAAQPVTTPTPSAPDDTSGTPIPVNISSDSTAATDSQQAVVPDSTPASDLKESDMKETIDDFIASNPTLSSSAEPSQMATPTPVQPAAEVTSAPTEEPAVPAVETPQPQSEPKTIPVTTPEPVETAQETAAATPVAPDQSEQAMAAVDGLLGKTSAQVNTPEAAEAAPDKPSNEYVSENAGEPEQSMAHTKRIEPLSDGVADQTPSINELLAQEADHPDPTPPAVNSVITPGGGSISPLPGSSVQDAIAGGNAPDAQNETTPDANNITL